MPLPEYLLPEGVVSQRPPPLYPQQGGGGGYLPQGYLDKNS